MTRAGNGYRWKVIAIGVVALGLCASYGLALLGEPQSAWLWGIGE